MKPKTKCMVFNCGNKLCKVRIRRLNDREIEDVKSFKYLGYTKNCSFNETSHDLNIKAKIAIFALNSKLKLSQMPINFALKGFISQVLPILLFRAEVWGALYFSGMDKCGRKGTIVETGTRV